jgi:putative ABC transport system permease protein
MRKLRWDSMRVNFFVIGPPALVGRFPASYISAFRLEPGDEPLMNELTARFPNLTVVDVGAAVRQAQGVVDQVITAVQVVFLFALGAGLLVLYSALVATEDERRREAAVMRVYGASRAQVTGSQRVEFLAMGLLAGVLATAGSSAIGQLLARRVFELDLPPSPESGSPGRRRRAAAVAQRLAVGAQGPVGFARADAQGVGLTDGSGC